MEREACVCDHGYERSDLCAEIIIIRKGLHKFSMVRKEIHLTCPSEIATVQKLGFGIM